LAERPALPGGGQVDLDTANLELSGGRSIRVTKRARVDFPQPDSPTTASVWPALRVKVASLRARTVPADPKNVRLTS
jgi:hypothetical protein